jgi:hypothetical protein
MEQHIAKISKLESKRGESTNRSETTSPLTFGGSKRDVFKSFSPSYKSQTKDLKKKLDKIRFFPVE